MIVVKTIYFLLYSFIFQAIAFKTIHLHLPSTGKRRNKLQLNDTPTQFRDFPDADEITIVRDGLSYRFIPKAIIEMDEGMKRWQWWRKRHQLEHQLNTMIRYHPDIDLTPYFNELQPYLISEKVDILNCNQRLFDAFARGDVQILGDLFYRSSKTKFFSAVSGMLLEGYDNIMNWLAKKAPLDCSSYHVHGINLQYYGEIAAVTCTFDRRITTSTKTSKRRSSSNSKKKKRKETLMNSHYTNIFIKDPSSQRYKLISVTISPVPILDKAENTNIEVLKMLRKVYQDPAVRQKKKSSGPGGVPDLLKNIMPMGTRILGAQEVMRLLGDKNFDEENSDDDDDDEEEEVDESSSRIQFNDDDDDDDSEIMHVTVELGEEDLKRDKQEIIQEALQAMMSGKKKLPSTGGLVVVKKGLPRNADKDTNKDEDESVIDVDDDNEKEEDSELDEESLSAAQYGKKLLVKMLHDDEKSDNDDTVELEDQTKSVKEADSEQVDDIVKIVKASINRDDADGRKDGNAYDRDVARTAQDLKGILAKSLRNDYDEVDFTASEDRKAGSKNDEVQLNNSVDMMSNGFSPINVPRSDQHSIIESTKAAVQWLYDRNRLTADERNKALENIEASIGQKLPFSKVVFAYSLLCGPGLPGRNFHHYTDEASAVSKEDQHRAVWEEYIDDSMEEGSLMPISPMLIPHTAMEDFADVCRGLSATSIE